MSHVRNLVRTGAAGTVAFAIVVAASGWLYLIRPWTADLPGPKVHDALPFDELALHAKAPLVVFLAVWLVAATLLAALVRLTRAERLTVALLLALGVGAWSFAYTGLAILIVRQVTPDQAFAAAAAVNGVYLPPVIAGLAGALGGRARTCARPRSPVVLAWFVAAAGG